MPVGVFEQGFPQTAAPLGAFAAATGVRPRLAVYYSGWNESFRSSFATGVYASGATPVVQLQPTGISLTAIASGQWDGYLRRYAAAVKAYGHPVMLSFGNEMNGTWYSWGSGHQAPTAFVAAWRHVVTVFRQAGAANVTWLWTVNIITGSASSPRPWWPGSQWVNRVGIDGYYYSAADTFASVYGETLAQIREFTSTPAMISEVGIGPNPSRESQISSLFAGARADHLQAIIWFDQAQDDGIYHQDWRLEGDPAALAAFKAAALGTRRHL
jgi:mannan endo-1,4-beta-mannosidase